MDKAWELEPFNGKLQSVEMSFGDNYAYTNRVLTIL